MTTPILWRDVCAMSKQLRKNLVARALGAKLPHEDALQLIKHIQPKPAYCSAHTAAPAFNALPKSAEPLLVMRASKQGPLEGGLLLGDLANPKTWHTLPPKSWFAPSKKLWITDTGLLRNVVMYGSTGAGKTETLLTIALNAADPRPAHQWSQAAPARNVFHMDGKGDNSLYTKTLSGLSERNSVGNLRVINMLTGGQTPAQIKETGLKLSHSVDLFDGFDDHMLARWLVDMVPSNLSTTIDKATINTMMSTIAKLAIAFARQEHLRITPSVLAHLMTKEGAQDHAQHLAGIHGHLASHWLNTNWGSTAPLAHSVFLQFLHDIFTTPFQGLEHIFEEPHPDVNLSSLFASNNQPFYLLVLAPSLFIAPDNSEMVTRAIATSFRMALEHREPMNSCDTVAIIDEFDYCLQAKDIIPMCRLQNRGCGVIWAASEYNTKQMMGLRTVFDISGVTWGTHIMMRHEMSDVDLKHNKKNMDHLTHHQTSYPQFSIPSLRTLSDLMEGRAFVWSGDGCWPTLMDYANVPSIRSSFLTHVPPSPAPHYELSSKGWATIDMERQSHVLHRRHTQWLSEGNLQAPPLSWCQETVAQMLGFSNWHEAHEVLGKKDD